MSIEIVTIFYSYAQTDANLRDNLEAHLKKYQRYISHVYDRKILAGDSQETVIENYVRKADILLLLVSPDLVGLEEDIMCLVRKRQEAGALRIIPIHLRPFNWYHEYFSKLKLQSLPLNGQPVTTYHNQDRAFEEIAKELLRVVEEILKKKYKALAERYYSEENYKESLLACEQAIFFDRGSDASLYQLQGDLLTHDKSFKDALKYYEKALSLEPYNALLLEKKGLILFSLGEYGAAVDTYKYALQHTAANPSIFCNLGDALRKLRDFAGASESYREAIRLKPDNAQLYIRTGDIFLERLDPEEALHWYEEAIGREYTNASFYAKKGDAFMMISNYEEALDAYDKAIELKEDNAEFFKKKARALERLGAKNATRDPAFFDRAIEAYEQALRLHPEDYYSLKELGDVLFKLERFEDALYAYEDAIRRKQDFGLAYLGKGEVLERQAHDMQKLAQQAFDKAERLGFSRRNFQGSD